MKRYKYAILGCSPTAMGESTVPLLVFVRELPGDASSKLFISTSWKSQTPKELHRYLSDTISSVSVFSAEKLDQFLVELKKHSIGPLRVVSEGTCKSETKLHKRLEEIFHPFGYSNIKLKLKRQGEIAQRRV